MRPVSQEPLSADIKWSGRRGGARSSRAQAGTPPSRFRTVLAVARIEASLLGRSVLVLAGLLAGGILAWDFIHRGEPLWWNADWQIGDGQMILSMTVLAAAQLAAGRASRDGMLDLYESGPVSAATRTVAQLIAVVGAVPASLVLIGAATTFVELRGAAIGAPNPAVLVGGVLLVIAAGAVGIAIGKLFPHPLAGMIGAIIWFVPFSQSNNISGAVTGLFPWVALDQLNQLPSPLSGYPPAVAHAVELAGIAALAGVAAFAPSIKAVRQRIGLIAVGALAVAVICVAGAVQLQPIPTPELNHLVAEVAFPASAQHCTTTNGAQYCLYPGFNTVLRSLQAPVNGVLALVPARPASALTISQTSTLTLDTTLTHGHSRQQLAAWSSQLQDAPANAAAASTIYVTVGAWPTGGQLAIARFDVALGTAEWAVGLPTSTANTSQSSQCVPLDQAREAIAIWLAVLAAHTSVGQVQVGIGGAGGSDRITLVQVENTPVVAWSYPGENTSYLASPGPQTTAAGALLAKAMTSLPAQRVTEVLDAGWATWSNWHTTDTQLAAALGIPTPTVPALVNPRTGQALSLPPAGGLPSQPVCAT